MYNIDLHLSQKCYLLFIIFILVSVLTYLIFVSEQDMIVIYLTSHPFESAFKKYRWNCATLKPIYCIHYFVHLKPVTQLWKKSRQISRQLP